MTDLKGAFARLRKRIDTIEPPELLPDAYRRSHLIAPARRSPWRRVAVAAVALAIALASLLFASEAFETGHIPAGPGTVLPYPLAYTGAEVPDPHWAHGQLWLMDETGQRSTLTSIPGDQTAVPAWSPDGSQIAFAAQLDDVGTQIWVINADGTGLHEVTRMVPFDSSGHPDAGSAINDSPAWSPDGTKIAFNCYNGQGHQVCVVNADGSGSGPDMLTSRINVAHDTPPIWVGPNELMFSTFGSAGACVADPSSTCDEAGSGETYTLRLGTDELSRIGTARPQMTLSPNGDRIAFLCPTKDAHGYAVCTERTDLTYREQVTSPPIDLAAGITDSDSSPAWLPDGRLSFLREQRAFDGFHLYVINGAGNPDELLNLGTDVRGMSWGPSQTPHDTATPSAETPSPTAVRSAPASSIEPTTQQTSESMLLDKPAGVRCTATVPAMVRPGEQLPLTIEIQNTSAADVEVTPFPADVSVKAGDGTVWDTATLTQGSMGGGFILPKNLSPGEQKELLVPPLAVQFSGPLAVTPTCLGAAMAPMPVEVSDLGQAPTPDEAVATAVTASSGLFGPCAPTATHSATGTIVAPSEATMTMEVRCSAQVVTETGFDVVTLVMSTPSDKPAPQIPTGIVTPPELAAGSGAAETLVWRFVVTGTDVFPVGSSTHFRTKAADAMDSQFIISARGWRPGGASGCGGDGIVSGGDGRTVTISFYNACG